MSSYEGFRFGKVGDFFSSQDIYMYMSGQECNLELLVVIVHGKVK